MSSPPSPDQIKQLGTLPEQGLIPIWTDPADAMFTREIYVLVDRNTASTAEVVAGFLQAVGRATIVGEQSLGEFLNAEVADMGHGLELVIPTAEVRLFDGTRLEGVGVTPDLPELPED